MFFLGYRKTHKLHQALERSLLFQHEQLMKKTPLKWIRMQGADYIGISLSPVLSYAELLQKKARLVEMFCLYCPELLSTDPELLFESLSP